METIELLEGLADITIAVLVLWAGLMFWNAYRLSGHRSSWLLSIAFAFIGLFKLFQFIVEVMLSIDSFSWMDTVLAAEALVVILSAVVVITLYGSCASRPKKSGKLKIETPESEKREDKRTAA